MPLYQSVRILPINKLFELQLGKFMFQHSLPKSLSNIFLSNSNIHSRHTRHRHDSHLRQRNTDKFSQYFTHKATDIGYNLSQEMKQLKSINGFTNKMKYYLMQ